MLNDKGPMLFINSVNTQVDESSQQKVYDSRVSVNSKDEKQSTKDTSNASAEASDANKLEFLETRKLNNIIEMYHKRRPVLCNIIVGDREVVGIPYQKDDNKLLVSIGEEVTEELNIDDIDEIIIIKF